MISKTKSCRFYYPHNFRTSFDIIFIIVRKNLLLSCSLNSHTHCPSFVNYQTYNGKWKSSTSSNLIQPHDALLGSTLNHTPTKYRYPFSMSSQIRPTWGLGAWRNENQSMHVTVLPHTCKTEIVHNLIITSSYCSKTKKAIPESSAWAHKWQKLKFQTASPINASCSMTSIKSATLP